jgi:TRAP-type C4-dicarboxylate transport system permease small subunit
MNIEKIDQYFLKTEKYLGASLIGAMFVIISINVMLRYFFSAPIFWAEELATYMFIYSTFLSAAYAVGHGTHVKISLVFNKFPPLVKKLALILGHILVIGVFLPFYGPTFEALGMLPPSPAMQFPEKYIYVALPVTFTLFILHSVFQIVYLLIKLSRNNRAPEWD